MTSYYSICPQQQYKLTHDISIENFASLTADPSLTTKPSPDVVNNIVNDVVTLKKQLSSDDNKNTYHHYEILSSGDVIDSNRLLELGSRSPKTSISSSKDSGNESDNNGGQKSSSKGREQSGVKEESPLLEDKVSVSIQTADKIVPVKNTTSYVDGGKQVLEKDVLGKSAELERVHERMKELGLRNSFEEVCKDQQAFSREEPYVAEAAISSDINKLRTNKKPRRPRKLPEIPPNVIRRAPRHPVINWRSLADELAEADPFYRVKEPSTPDPLSPNGDTLTTTQPCVSYQPGQQSMHDQFYSLTYGEPTTPGPLDHLDDQSVFSLMDKCHQQRQHTKRLIRTDSTPDSEDIKGGFGRLKSRRYSGDLEELEVTHRGCHKFVPRHKDEMFIEIGDPIYVEVEADDLWCEGINLRSGVRGIFPSVYATDLSFLEIEDGKSMKPRKFNVRFLGSVEVNYHKGNDVITNAINKVIKTRRMTLNAPQPPVCHLEVSEYGIKMTDKESSSKPCMSKRDSLRNRLSRILSKDKDGEGGEHNLFFSLKNVAFCGFHPDENRYFGFITKHPLEMRFACHVFCSEKLNSKVITDAVGTAFRTYYTQYMAFVHPTEDIYLE